MKNVTLVFWTCITLSFVVRFIDMSSFYVFSKPLSEVGYGWIVYMIYYAIAGRKSKNLNFIMVYSHEMSHAIFVLLLRRKLIEFRAMNNDTGYVTYSHGRQSVFIGLSPYFFIPLVWLSLLLLPIINHSYWWLLKWIAGFFLGFYHVTFSIQCRSYQTDLKDLGVAYSHLFIIMMNLLNMLLLVFVCCFGWSSLIDILWDGFRSVHSFISELFI